MKLTRLLQGFYSSLYTRLALVFLTSLVIMSLATAWIAIGHFNQLGSEWLQRNRIELATHLARRLKPALNHGLEAHSLQQAITAIKRINPALSLYVLDNAGRVVGSWENNNCALGQHISTAAIKALLAKMPMLPITTSMPCRATRGVFSVAPIHYGGNATPGYLFVGLEGDTHLSMTHMWQTSSIMRSLLAVSIGALLLTALLGLLLFALLARPFKRLTRAVQQFADGDHSQRIVLHSNDEVGQAANAFNEMAAIIEAQVNALRESDRQRRDLVAKLSHDFRTPLTALQGYAEQLQQTVDGKAARQVAALLTNTQRLTRLAEQLSLLSRVDVAERNLQTDALPLAELMQDITCKLQPKADAGGIELRAECAANLVVNADIELLDRALSNLIDNALNATQRGDRVLLTAQVQGLQVKISVIDNGCGIAANEIGLVTQRFYRTQTARKRTGGSGLGLAIVAEICARHGTDLTLTCDGQNTTASFNLARQPR